MKSQKLLDKLLWQGKAKTNLLLAAFGFAIGLFMLLASCHLYFSVYKDIRKQLNATQHSDFLVINKSVQLANTLSFSSTDFDEKERKELDDQEFVEDQGSFESNRFRITGKLGGQIRVQSDLFFESVEDRFLDITPEEWNWKKGDTIVPLIISTDFLNLYNFGFASSQNLPQLSRTMVTQVPLFMTLSGNGKSAKLTAKVAGFSDRYFSALAPRSFMDWANKEFSNDPEANPSRLIIRVSDPSDARISRFLDEHNYETNKDKLKATAKSVVSALLYITTALGFLFTLLSVLIFIMFFQLIISRSNQEIKLMVELGYKLGQIRKVLLRHLLVLAAGVYIFVYLILWIINKLASGFLMEKGFEIPDNLHPSIYAAGLILAVLVFLFNRRTMNMNLKKLFR